MTSAQPAEAMICGYCCMPLDSEAQKCPHCNEWVVETSISGVNHALLGLGWAWLVLSVIGALVLWSSLPSDTVSPYGTAAPSMWSGAVGVGLVFALALQGAVFGLAIISFAQRAPRQP